MRDKPNSTRRAQLVLSVCWMALAAARCTAAGPYEIDWYTIDAGGGTSSGGAYTLSGTIGQPDAHYSAGGPYELLAGFWPGSVLFECFGVCLDAYPDWVALGRPDCWCEPTQCHGDADGLVAGSAHKIGFYHVGPADLNTLISAWLVKEPPFGPGIASIADGVCADFDHQPGGSDKAGIYRVGPTDLNILITYWLVMEPPQGAGVPADCLDCP